jgi:hypothetical protein
LAELEAHHLDTNDPPRGRRRRRPVQPSLFAGTTDPVLQALREFDADGASPEEVREQLKRWQRDLRS